MANQQQNDPTKGTPGSPVNPEPVTTKQGDSARKTPHAAGSGSSTGDPGNARGQGRAATTKE
jgi:hypothetical protein